MAFTQTTLEDAASETAFAERAAKAFAKNPKIQSFSDAAITPGCYLALRWGLLERGVLAIKVDPNSTVKNYVDAVAHVVP